MGAKKWVIISGLIVTGIIAAFSLMKSTGWNQTAFLPVTRAVREIAAPLQTGIMKVKEGTGDFFAYFSNNKQLRQENEALKKQIAALENKVYSLHEQEMENERLKRLLAYKEENAETYELVLAKIIGRDLGNWYKTVTINKGEKDGISKEMAVVTHQGLVGMVISTTANTAEVLLILDTESAVGARILENRVTPGIAVGMGQSDKIQMIHLPHNAPLEEGQTIVTSGLGGLYPEGIRIGTVSEVMLEPSGLIKNAVLETFVDFNRLEEVFVIVHVKRIEVNLTSPSMDEETNREEVL